jgi:nicotinate-nucleotide--dimethylbenzimidazole phosphoribosyltransferase
VPSDPGTLPMAELDALIGSIPTASDDVRAAVAADLDAKAQPRRSLGMLEELAARYAAIRHERRPDPPAFALVVAAADHGISRRGVSAYPPEVTAQMVAALAGGGAAVCVLARQAGARLLVVDAGSLADARPDGVLDVRTQRGSGDIVSEPAMNVAEAVRLLLAGARTAGDLIADGATAIGLGEMGIGNSAVAAALTAALLDFPAERVTGRGTGVDDAGLAAKTAAVAAAVQRAHSAPGQSGALHLLAHLGGHEIAFLAGVTLGAAARRTPVVIDGYISTSAALVATSLAPAAASALIASHLSPEPGHALALEHLRLRPLLDLGLRLGEGSGAALTMPIVSAAVAILRDMATFDSAQVTDSGA